MEGRGLPTMGITHHGDYPPWGLPTMGRGLLATDCNTCRIVLRTTCKANNAWMRGAGGGGEREIEMEREGWKKRKRKRGVESEREREREGG